jgi:hypothetical protein
MDLSETIAVDEDEQYNMASLGPEQTGVDNSIFVSVKGRARHSARIKIAIDPPNSFDASCRTVSMTIHDCRVIGSGLTPKVRDQAKTFIVRNRRLLLEYWNGQLLTADFIAKLR